MKPRRRLLTISHSYVVGLNRRFADELARAGGAEWDVTAFAPSAYHGDLRFIPLERHDHEVSSVRSAPAHFTRSAHLFFWGLELARTLREPWDLIHAWEEPYIVAGAQVALLARREVPFVFSTFQNIDKRYPPPFRQLESYVVGRSEGWIAFGETVRRSLGGRAGYRDRPVAQIPPGVDTERFRPDRAAGAAVRRALGWSADGPPVIGFLGRLIPSKGLDMLCRALARIDVPWRALFVGGGEMEAQLRAWGERFGDRVRVVTNVKHDDVPEYLNAMDVMCCPSQTTPKWREQFGRMIIEAFACGVAVVGSDSGEVPHTIGGAGRVLPERDEDAWVEGLRELLSRPELIAELGAMGRARAEERFAWPQVARRTLSFFDDVLESHQGHNRGRNRGQNERQNDGHDDGGRS
jgi:glycosyltransferase involved in cell wall biosynthesis